MATEPSFALIIFLLTSSKSLYQLIYQYLGFRLQISYLVEHKVSEV